MDAIARACAQGRIPCEVALVLSDVSGAGILAGAKSMGVPAVHLAPGPYRARLSEDAEAGYLTALRSARVDVVVLAGFMRILKGAFLRAYPLKVLNIHPSLLPAFPGLEAWKQAFDYGVKVTGCSVHFVDEGVDSGPIIGQRAVPVLAADTVQTLHARIQEAEHILYPEVLGWIAQGRVKVQGRRALVEERA